MRLFIEEWAEKNLSEIGIEIMKEAILCYKVGAYRSAFLMSYLSFKQTIRDRILEFESKVPESIKDQDKWEQEIISKLNDDDKWETSINEIVNASVPNSGGIKSKIFCFSNVEEIKSGYMYWKNIRNSCAHAKEKKIDCATVEQFWNYMQDDLPEYYILGGEKYLTNKLYNCYKFFNSTGKEEIKTVLKRIAAFYKSNVKKCFFELEKNDKNMFLITEKNSKFWDEVYNYPETKKGCIDFLYEQEYYFLSWFKEYPNVLIEIDNEHGDFIQKYSKEMLQNGGLVFDRVSFWKILYYTLIKNDNLVDLDKLTSNHDNFKLIKYLEEDLKEADIDVHIFKKYKVFNLFINNAGKDLFKNDSTAHYNYFKEYNNDYSAIEECFKYIEWDIEIVNRIENSIDDLEKSMKLRENIYAKINGNERKSIFETIIKNGKESIKDICNKNGGLDKFQNISKLL
jgi:hypothetical protein